MLRMSLEQILDELREFNKDAKEKYKISILGVFGSVVRGEQSKQSDLDVLIEIHQGASLFDLCGIAADLEEHFGCKVDVIPQKNIREELKENILSEALYL